MESIWKLPGSVKYTNAQPFWLFKITISLTRFMGTLLEKTLLHGIVIFRQLVKLLSNGSGPHNDKPFSLALELDGTGKHVMVLISSSQIVARSLTAALTLSTFQRWKTQILLPKQLLNGQLKAPGIEAMKDSWGNMLREKRTVLCCTLPDPLIPSATLTSIPLRDRRLSTMGMSTTTTISVKPWSFTLPSHSIRTPPILTITTIFIQFLLTRRVFESQGQGGVCYSTTCTLSTYYSLSLNLGHYQCKISYSQPTPR